MLNDRLEILTEEESMKVFLEGFLPRILPQNYKLGLNCFIRAHEGKQHLLNSISGKFRAYSSLPYLVRVLIIHDQDSNDCIKLKSEIAAKCNNNIPFLIRIACRELENWYLGYLIA